MELWRAGEALARNCATLPYLASYSPRTIHPRVPTLSGRVKCSSPIRSRTLTTSARLSQDANNENGAGERSDLAPASPQPARNSSSEADALAKMLDSDLDFSPKPSSPLSQPSSPPSAFVYRQGQGGKDLDDLLDSVQRRETVPRQKSIDLLNTENWGISGTSRTKPPAVVLKQLPYKLGPSVGRAVQVSDRIDLARAFQMMEITCARNSVRRDAMRQRFHERPGLKRKRLKSVRWRVRFKAGFKGVIKRVRKMKKQGW